ncbi:Cytoplasmic FMR1-interacting domain-containing protein [Rozella allomycis CSF55]|uniref:Cytoplasmic FMR1-interacting domain-containing protein n=1 Tax=Rozella allomycis (strain CSF55) TaxID=988480 RepID=A0A075ATJ9_ROZAC|nr:Cytoplasmic FMR1-interacting domain-containing protein [Rozella allomycis CSF55]|eukprot:EPZ31877.1 Cytoplasmic FMR1-interacting domain-containing protein [Rozella allomycis CSF55]
MEIFSDAATRALAEYKSQYLYNEIEAELSLCFDQLIFKLGLKICNDAKYYTMFKFLPKDLTQDMSNEHDFLTSTFSSKYDPIMRFRRYWAKELLFSIKTLENIHRVTSKYYLLDNFSSFLSEVTGSNSLCTTKSRLTAHMVNEVVADFMPNFNFNIFTNSFTRSTVTLTYPHRSNAPRSSSDYLYGNKLCAQMIEKYFNQFNRTINMSHFNALSSLIHLFQAETMISELSDKICDLINFRLAPYLEILLKAVPVDLKLPLFEYGSLVKIKPIQNYEDLETEVLKIFKEIGNALCFINFFENSILLAQVQNYDDDDSLQKSANVKVSSSFNQNSFL